MHAASRRPLAGINVVEISGGTAAAYCGRLLVDAGASVSVLAATDGSSQTGARADTSTERLYAAYVMAGKTRLEPEFVRKLPASVAKPIS